MTLNNLTKLEAAFKTRKDEQTVMEFLEVAKSLWYEADIDDNDLARVLRQIAYWLEFH